MKIKADGMKRKEIAQRIGESLGLEVAYLGTPSFSYKIGEYILDMDMNFHCEDENILKIVRKDFNAENEE